MKVVTLPWSVSVTVAMEIKTTVVSVGWAVTVIVGNCSTPFDKVRVRVSASAFGLEVITVTIPELNAVADRDEPGAETEDPEAETEDPGAKGDWGSGLDGWGWGCRGLRLEQFPDGLGFDIGIGMGVMVKTLSFKKCELS